MLAIKSVGYADDPATARFGPGKRYLHILHYVTARRGYFNGHEVREGQAFLIYPGQLQEYHSDPDEPWGLFSFITDDPLAFTKFF